MLARLVTLTEALPHLLATITYTHSVVYGAWSTINPVTWSLETEIQFYIIAPALAMVFIVKDQRIRVTLLLVMWVASLRLPDVDDLAPYNLQFSLVVYLHVFLVGFIFCEIYVHTVLLLRGHRRIFDVLGVVALIGVFTGGFNSRLLFDLFLLVFMVSVFRGVWLNQTLRNRYITAIGGACYSLYLLHYAVIFAIMTLTSRLVLPWFPVNLGLQFALSLFAVLVIGMLFFRWCERPFDATPMAERVHGVGPAVGGSRTCQYLKKGAPANCWRGYRSSAADGCWSRRSSTSCVVVSVTVHF